MQFETFDLGNRQIIDDPEREKEMRKYIDDLGLVGQKKMIVGQDDKIIPFPKMTTSDERVWEIICPEKTEISKYDAQIIPFEVLELVSMVKMKGYFDINTEEATEKGKARTIGYIEIWDMPKEQIDPLVVGVIKKETQDTGSTYWYTRNTAKFLLARWGHELQPFAKIVEQARKFWSDKRTADARKKISECQKAIECVEADAIEHFGGGWVTSLPF